MQTHTTTRSTIWSNYNTARGLVRDGILDAGRLNRALGIAQSKERTHLSEYHTTTNRCECPDSKFSRGHVCKGRIALVLLSED
jgi:hypothetical protein